MEKTIKLVMNDDSSIRIFVGGNEKYTIRKETRTISAEEVYQIFDFKSEDSYVIKSENKPDRDNQVLEFFAGLFEDICKKINELTPPSEF